MSDLFKYPRTFHVPWSEGATSDDKMLASMDHFCGKHVVVTKKYDGENTSMYRDACHARSLDSKNHPSRDFVKGIWGRLRYEIPEGMRICGENLYAKHSIHYTNLPGYFMVFAIYDKDNICLSWNDTADWAELLGLPLVSVLYSGPFAIKPVQSCWMPESPDEGYVMRTMDAFPWAEHHLHTAKFVKAGHVGATSPHWMSEEIVPNLLALRDTKTEDES
jgi:hypothetical protein